MNQSSLFIDALKNHDRAGIISAEKSDIHNHVGRGGNADWLSRRLNVSFSPPPKRFLSLSHMQDWYERNIKPFFIGREGIMLRWEACFAEAERNNIKRLALIFTEPDVDLAGGMEAFMSAVTGYHKKYCPDTIFEPELAYSAYCDPDEVSARMPEFLDYGFFRSIDINSGENVQPMSAYKPIYRQAERYGLIKRIHVGETGSARDVMAAVDELGVDEIHHGIAAASDRATMKLLADRNIQLNICPSSNVMLGLVSDYSVHPIKILAENGVPVTINTDDLLIFRQSIDMEYENLYSSGVLTAEELDRIRLRGLKSIR